MSRRFYGQEPSPNPFIDYASERHSASYASAQQEYYALMASKLRREEEEFRRREEEQRQKEQVELKRMLEHLQNENKTLQDQLNEQRGQASSVIKGRVDIRADHERNDSEVLMNYAKSVLKD